MSSRPAAARDRPLRVAVRRRTGKNFVDTMLRLGAERDEVAVVDDQIGCPTYTGHLAEALVTIAERGLTGILHVAGGGSCSWYDLGGGDVRARRALSAPSSRAPRPSSRARRPGPPSACWAPSAPTPRRLPPWRDGLRGLLRELARATRRRLVS